MSVIVGLIDNGEIYMAADSACAALDRSWLLDDATPKIWRHGQFLVGVVGKQRIADIILDSIEPERKVLPHEYADMVRAALKENGSLRLKDGIESMEAEILLGWRSALYHVVSDFGIVTPKATFHAIGSGAQYALGALHVLPNFAVCGGPAAVAKMAVEAAAAFSPYVGGRTVGLTFKAEEAA